MLLVLWAYLFPVSVWAKGPLLEAMHLSTLEGNQIRLQFTTSVAVNAPSLFSTQNPARIVLDFEGVGLGMDRKNSRLTFNSGLVNRIQAVAGEDRTRVVIELNELVPHDLKVQGQHVVLMLANETPTSSGHFQSLPFNGTGDMLTEAPAILNIDFHRGAQQEGRVLVDLSDENIPIDFKEEGNKVRIRFVGATISPALERHLEVTDFGTNVTSINTVKKGNDVEMVVTWNGYSENIAYQADKRFTLEVRPLTKQEKEALTQKNFEYTGERLSLNFQDIEVRAVLQLIADFTGLNIVTSDTVRGNVTLRLRNVPWDQALAIILKTKGLAKRQVGNVLLIGPSEELAAREKLELQTNQQVEELAPLHSEFVQINYAKASALASLLKDEANSLLSARGNVSVDERTNTLLVQDTANKLDEIREMVHRLDIPVRQVLIEARVVFANDDFEKALGVNFGAAAKFRPGNEPRLGLAGNRVGATDISGTATVPGIAPSDTTLADRLVVNLPVTLPGGGGTTGLGLAIAQLPGGTILDLELQALESEGLGKVVASPRLITSNQKTAYIEAGEEIPYLEATSSGAASVSFKKAVLRLEVTPQITPDNHVVLDLTVNQDSRGAVTAGIPAIDTREIHTQVLVANGETVVLGGIYTQTKKDTIRRVPFLGRLPGIGWLFRSKIKEDRRNELMIFVTPKIVKEGMA